MTDTISTREIEGLQLPAPGTFDLDTAHTHVGFVVRHMMVSKVRGRFTSYTGSVTIGEGLQDSSVEVTIDAGSIDTREEARDNHLRSADFFETEKYPEWTFKSTGLTPTGKGEFELAGDLTLHGVTRPVTLQVEQEGIVMDPYGNERIGFSATGEIDREDFGIAFNMALEAGGVVVGKTVKLEIEVEAIRRREDAAATA